MSKFDIERARRDTLGCHELIHFNNAGAALMPKPVARSQRHYLELEERFGGYEIAAREADTLEGFYTSMAALLNCDAGEIAFVENATRAWDMAFYSFIFKPGDKILTTISEYGSNVIAYQQRSRRDGIEVVFVPDNAYGEIDTHALEQLIDDRVKLISMTHIPTGGGLVNPAQKVGQIARAAGIPFLLDSCQGVGQMPINVKEIGCDIVTGTGRKYLRGPRGTGLLYVRQGLIEQLDPPFLDQHAAELISPTSYVISKDARRFENWEQNFAGKAALKTAIDYAMSYGLESIQARVYELAAQLRYQLAKLDGVSLTDQGREKCGIVTFTTQQCSPGDIKAGLSAQQINLGTSKGSGSLVSFKARGLTEVVRASLHYYNTEQEIDHFIDVLQQILRR